MISLSGSNVYTTWSNGTAPSEIGFRAGTTTSTCVLLNATQYRATDSAFIAVANSSLNVDPGTAETIQFTISSFDINDNPQQITVPLLEDGLDTGNFTGTISFTETGSSSGSILLVGPDKIVTLVDATVSIFPRIVSFLLSAGGSDTNSYTLSQNAFLEVTDLNSNVTNTFDNVTVTLQSTATSDSISLFLNETTATSGVFNRDVFVFNEAGSGEFPISGTVTISQSDPGGTPTGGPYSSSAIDKIDVTVSSDSEPGGVPLSLIETGVDTRDFERKLTFSTSASVDNSTLKVSSSDFITFTIFGETARGIIITTPITNSSRGSLQGGIGSTITATFQGISDTVTIILGGAGGGGGGGISRPGLVLDVIASLSSGIGGGGSVPVVTLKSLLLANFIDIPDEIKQVVINFDPFTPLEPFDVTAEQFETFDFPLSIDNDGYALSGYSNTLDTKTLYTGEATKIKTVFYMPLKLEHVAFYTNIGKGDSLDDSDAFLRFWESKPDQFQIKDENGFFEYINLTIEEVGIKKTVTFDIKFQKPMAKSDIVLRMWDEKLHSITVLIFDAIEVVGPSQEQLEETSSGGLEIPESGEEETLVSELRIEETLIVIPDWIKTNAKWWNEGQITDTDFAKGIEYLIQNEIMRVPTVEVAVEEMAQSIPDWAKSNAGWWADGLLSDQEFVNGIQWLIENGIIRI